MWCLPECRYALDHALAECQRHGGGGLRSDRFEDFASIQDLVVLGDAAVFDGALRLTPAKRGKIGAVWLREKQPILAKFETTFQFQLTHQNVMLSGADGFAFVMQNSGPRAFGWPRSAGGFGVADSSNPHHPGIPGFRHFL